MDFHLLLPLIDLLIEFLHKCSTIYMLYTGLGTIFSSVICSSTRKSSDNTKKEWGKNKRKTIFNCQAGQMANCNDIEFLFHVWFSHWQLRRRRRRWPWDALNESMNDLWQFRKLHLNCIPFTYFFSGLTKFCIFWLFLVIEYCRIDSGFKLNYCGFSFRLDILRDVLVSLLLLCVEHSQSKIWLF